jgi:creatinine amidohydrolase/Fe(II)-dependent formamide hydrolase-like protein
MNERIKELAEQAGLLGPSSRVGKAHDATEKFAELIIQDVLKEIYDDVQYITDFDTADQIVASVKKQFGVEE